MSKITILMPAYNAAKYIAQTLDSIYQSSVQSFDILICNDSSTDNTCAVIEQYQRQHSNITLIHNDVNYGAGYTRAKMMRLVTTEFVAFCDADDIIHSDRFHKQLAYFKSHPDISVLGSHLRIFNGNDIDNTKMILYSVEYDIDIKTLLLYSNTMFTPSVMMRNAIIKKTGVEYDASMRVAEDYDYWIRLAPYVKFANIQEPLVSYRRHDKQLTHQKNGGYSQSTELLNHVELSRKQLASYGFHIGTDAIRALCFPQYTSTLCTSRNTKRELRLLMQGLVRNDFPIPLSHWGQHFMLARLCPYVLSIRCLWLLMRKYQYIKSTIPTIRNYIIFCGSMVVLPLCIFRTVRALLWYIIYRIRFKPI